MNSGKEYKYRISASEIAQFHFCPMSWYLWKQGFSPASIHLKSGKMKHKKIGHLLTRSIILKKMVVMLEAVGVFLVIFSLLFYIIQVMI